MQELGNRLKTAREETGLTLRDIERATKIGIRMLEQIEAGEFDKLPKGIFARNFVRQYCEFINMEPDPVLKEAFETEAVSEESEPDTRSSPEKLPGWVLILIILVLIIVAGLWVWPGWLRDHGTEHKGSTNSFQVPESTSALAAAEKSDRKEDASTARSNLSESSESQTASAMIEENPREALVNKEDSQTSGSEESVATETGEQAVPVQQRKDRNDGDVVLSEGPVAVLEFRVTDRCWVHLKSPNRDMDFMLEAGEVYTISCGYPVVLTLGNAPSVSLSVNGKAVGFPEGQRVLRDFTIQAPVEGTQP